jgi:hypothetical protein
LNHTSYDGSHWVRPAFWAIASPTSAAAYAVKCSDLHRASLLPMFSDVPWNQSFLAPEAININSSCLAGTKNNSK